MYNPFRRKLKRDEVVQGLTVNFDTAVGPEFLSVPTAELPARIAEWVRLIETGVTRDICYCKWITHPQDINLPRAKQRAILDEHHDWCPVHEKQGFLLGFFNHMFPEQVSDGR